LNLGNSFPEKADTVYWLKITALVDVPQTLFVFDPFNPGTSPLQVTQWGWHNRDYTIKDTLASAAVAPGEFLDGTIGASPVYHFQDDAVAGDVKLSMLSPASQQNPFIQQINMSPQFYKDLADGPAGPMPGTQGISHFSKDLAFELYTTNNVPEPGTCLMFLSGCIGVALFRCRLARR
jgi:hypothetical protein